MRNTHNYLPVFIITLLTGAIAAPVFAQESEPFLDTNLLSIGGGIADNSVGSSDETGLQIFAAYDLNQVNLMEGVKSSVEIGWMDYGFSRDSTGIWGTYVVEGTIKEQLGWLARGGYDFGDDKGLMYGAGLDWAIEEKIDLRIEYVIRDDIDSLQFNILYHL